MRRRGSDLTFGFGSLENRSGGMDVRLLSDGSWWWWSRSGSDLDFGGGFSLFLCLLVLSSRLGWVNPLGWWRFCVSVVAERRCLFCFFSGHRCRCFKPVDRSLGGSSELPSVPVRLVCYGFSVAGAHVRRPVVGLVNHGCSSRWWRVRDCKYQGLDLGLPPGRFDSRRSLFSPSSWCRFGGVWQLWWLLLQIKLLLVCVGALATGEGFDPWRLPGKLLA